MQGIKNLQNMCSNYQIDFSANNQTIVIIQSEYKPVMQWFVKHYLGKDLKANNKRLLGFVLRFTKNTMVGLPTSFFNNWRKQATNQHCSGSLNNVNLQRLTYARLKWDIDKLKYEICSQNTDLNNQNPEFGGTLKCQKRAKNEFTHGKN